MHREVAVKIPHAKLVGKRNTVQSYLTEARATASLDHSGIIPVYRVSSTEEIPCYIVTKLIRGSHLGHWAKRRRPTFKKVAQMVAFVAEALAYAHKHGIVHRDVKPGNILVDDEDHPFVADFGLALRDVDPRSGTSFVGTPSYMSPEQARGEGHRVDGRSDLFSAGVVLYELLTGQRPFRASNTDELYDLILYSEPVHPCEINPNIPKELARVCLKSLSKAASDRYSTGELFAAELRAACQSDSSFAVAEFGDSRLDGDAVTRDISRDSSVPSLPAVVPKGLRAFGIHDAEFYPQLLPGPHDREGIPEIIRFWLSKLNPTGTEKAVSVGLIYGPSGCGKSSLVRAGIIPRMPKDVGTIYVQASASNTETDLITQIASRSALLPIRSHDQQENVVDAFTSLRRSRKSRTVIFIDQFEQWLFANPDCLRASLTEAIRQCDGDYLQCVLLVRDDFWMGVTRLMQILDLPIAENINVTSVDLFDARHARYVLGLYGTAYGKLPASMNMISPAQKRFVDAAVNYLARDGRVICVQLALLMEMLKGRSWETVAGVFDDGGTDLGTRFFQETFDSDSTPRRIRIHAEGSLRVLRALLPDLGSPIKGSRKTEEELFSASGYGDKKMFRELVAILDRELHLITPTDRSDDESLNSDSTGFGNSPTGYQLTHDFLISPIRKWTEYHSRATKRGQAKLRLDEFTELYRLHPREQSLPTMSEYIGIRRCLNPASYNEAQSQMMSAALRRHQRTLLRVMGVCAIILCGIGFSIGAIRNVRRSVQNQAVFDGLLLAGMNEAAQLSNELRTSEHATEAALELLADNEADLGRRVRASLVVADRSDEAANLLSEHLLGGSVDDVVDIVTGLDSLFPTITQDAFAVWDSQSGSHEERIRAAAILANDAEQAKWLSEDQNIRRLTQLILLENPLWIRRWREAFEPVADQLVPMLVAYLRDEGREEDSLGAINLVVEYASDDLPLLTSLVAFAKPRELLVLTDAIGVFESSGLRSLQRSWENASATTRTGADPSTPWGSPWWCAGERRPIALQTRVQLNSTLRQQLVEFESAMADHAILSHKIPLAEMESVTSQLNTFGYRIANVIPYTLSDQQMHAVLWLRDGRESVAEFGLSAEELREANERHRNVGRIPDAMHAYRSKKDDVIEYSCVWIDMSGVAAIENGDMYIDVHEDEHETRGWKMLGDRGLWLNRSCTFVRKSDGSNFFSSIRWQVKSSIDFRDQWNQSREAFENTQAYNVNAPLVAGRLSEFESEEEDRGITAIWWKNLPVVSRQVDYQTRREHFRAAQELLDEGCYPVSVGTSLLGDDTVHHFSSVWWKPLPKVEDAIRRGNRLKNLAFALFRLGDDRAVKSSIVVSEDPEVRGAVIEGFSELQLLPDWLIATIADRDGDARLRRSCAMALARFVADGSPMHTKQRVASLLLAEHQQASDPGLRSALEAVAHAWGIPLVVSSRFSPDEIQSVAGDRLVIVHPENPVWVGSANGEPGRDPVKELRTPFVIERSYAIATKNVTVDQFLKYSPEHGYAKDYASDVHCPIINVSWFDAAKYCRWLSEQEGLPESQMCYPPIEEIRPGLTLPADFIDRSGYRLPTEVEWEYACRGGESEGRWFGYNPDRLNGHAWTARNSDYRLRPVAGLLPNDYGLFDMLGNAKDICHTKYAEYPSFPAEPVLDPGASWLKINEDDFVPDRGGSVLYQPLDARAAQREFHLASSARVYLTFRIAKTIRPQK